MCIVGSGPSGFYVADVFRRMYERVRETHAKQDAVSQTLKKLHIDMLEKLPVPFGLVRYGVAPDHEDIKNVGAKFHAMAKNFVHWFGNVEVGRDVTVPELCQMYDIVVLASGADTPRRLDVPGTAGEGVLYAKDIVDWYNGHPLSTARQRVEDSLRKATSVVIVGHGNVSLDICRILCADREKLRGTDIDAEAFGVLSQMRIKNIDVVARRGVVDSRFSIKELREVLQMPSVSASLSPFTYAQDTVPLQKRRIIQLLADAAIGAYVKAGTSTNINFLYGRKPLSVGPDGVDFSVMEVEGQPVAADAAPFGGPAAHWRETAKRASSKGDLTIISTGFVPHRVSGVPYNANGNVCHTSGKVDGYSNLYVAGWAKEGSAGDIAWAVRDAQVTAAQILREQVQNFSTSDSVQSSAEEDDEMHEPLRKLLDARRVQFVRYSAWEHIESIEKGNGAANSKKAEKVRSVHEMLQLADEGRR